MISMTFPQYLRHECTVDGRIVRMRGLWAEALASLLVSHPARFVSRAEMIEAIWPNPDFEPDYASVMVDMCIHGLRRLGVAIEHDWGFGWRVPEHARIGKESVNLFAAEHSGNTQEERLAA